METGRVAPFNRLPIRMKLKNLFSFKKKRKKSKKNILDNAKPNKKKEIFKKFKKCLKNKKESFKKHKEKIDSIKEFLLIVLFYGLIINYSIHFIFGTKFGLLTFPAWGIAYYFIKDEFIEWFRRLIAK